MTESEKIGELYVEVSAIADKFKSDMAKLRSDVDKEGKKIEEKLSFKAKFDTSVANFRISELQKLRQKLQKEFEKKISIDVSSTSLDRTREKIAAVDARLKGVGESAKSLPGMFTNIAAGIGAAFGTAKIVSFAFEAVTLAGKVQGVKTAFDNLNQPGLLDNLRTATRNTVSDFELMKLAMRASNFKIPLTELATLLEFAEKRAAQTGQEVDYLVNSIIDGIGRKSTLVLDNLGISATELQAEFAKTGDFGKATANIIAREMGKMGDVVETSSTKLAQLNAQIENQKAEIGNGLLPIWNGLLKALGGGISMITAMGQELKRIVTPQKYYNDLLKEAIEKQQEYARAIQNTYTAFAKLSTFIVSTYKQQKDSVGQVKTKIDELTASQDNMVYGSKEYLKTQKEIEKLENSIGLGKDKSTSKNSDNYIEKLVNYLDEYRDKIKKLNDELSKIGEGDSEKKLILTVELSKLKEQLSREELKLNIKAGNVDQDFSDIKPKGLKVDDGIATKLKENLDLRLQAHQEYLDAVGLLNEEAFNEAKAKIDKEFEMFVAAGVAQEKAQAIHDAKMKELRDARQSQEDAILEAQLNNIAVLADSLGGFAATAKQLGGEQSAAYKLFAITQATIATYLAASKALAAVPFPFNFIAAGSVVAAGLANVSQIASAHSGGEFIGTSSGVKKMSGGGSFIVPPGFPNDSYPLLVESGERVTVTPSGKSGQSGLSGVDVDRIVNAIRAMNMNLVDKDFSTTIINNSPDVTTTVRRGEKIKSQLTRQGAKLDER